MKTSLMTIWDLVSDELINVFVRFFCLMFVLSVLFLQVSLTRLVSSSDCRLILHRIIMML